MKGTQLNKGSHAHRIMMLPLNQFPDKLGNVAIKLMKLTIYRVFLFLFFLVSIFPGRILCKEQNGLYDFK